MRKVFAVVMALMLVAALSIVPVLAAGSSIGTRPGKDGATGNWDGDIPKEADGDAIEISNSGDCYGFVFENLTPGVYKIALYMDLEEIGPGKQMRVSPRVKGTGSELRCWIDWRWTDSLVKAYDESGLTKVMHVSVINVPEGYNKIDVGFWQDSGAFVGKLEKVELATADYNLYNKDYFFMGEMNYRMNAPDGDDHSGTSFGEDPEQKLLAADGSWTPSAKVEEPAPTDPKTEEPAPTDPKTEEPAPTNDASTLFALLTAGAAVFGGLKLRKK